jgi:phosphopentomutase
MPFSRVVLIVMDGCGVGAALDAAEYGDTGENTPNTLGHLAEAVGGLNLPTLQSMGLGNIIPIRGVEPASKPKAFYGKVQPYSKGKDSVTGHWEMMGIHTEQPFPTYPEGFPSELIAEFEQRIGRKVLGNYPASGTEIIKQLGEEHLRTGFPIVYTSADSVFQIAAHEAVIPIEELYRMCEIAREMLQPPHHVQRVIARPFEGSDASTFRRTERRRDFPLPPPPNLIDRLAERGVGVYGIGVVPEIFTYRGFRYAERTQSNRAHFEAVLRAPAKRLRLHLRQLRRFRYALWASERPQRFRPGISRVRCDAGDDSGATPANRPADSDCGSWQRSYHAQHRPFARIFAPVALLACVGGRAVGGDASLAGGCKGRPLGNCGGLRCQQARLSRSTHLQARWVTLFEDRLREVRFRLIGGWGRSTKNLPLNGARAHAPMLQSWCDEVCVDCARRDGGLELARTGGTHPTDGSPHA